MKPLDDIHDSAGAPDALGRIRDFQMNRFTVQPEDLPTMEEIARVSSAAPGKDAWTELAVYYRAGFNRPFVGVVEGKTSRAGMRDRFQAQAFGTLDRTVNWFEGSRLRDQLAEAIPDDHETRFPDSSRARAAESPFSEAIRQALEAPEITLVSVAPRRLSGIDEARSPGTGGYAGPERLTDASRWLYPDAGQRSDSAIAADLARDFGIPERTGRNTLAIEAGRVEGKVGPWLVPFVRALRFFDRAAWETSRG